MINYTLYSRRLFLSLTLFSYCDATKCAATVHLIHILCDVCHLWYSSDIVYCVRHWDGKRSALFSRILASFFDVAKNILVEDHWSSKLLALRWTTLFSRILPSFFVWGNYHVVLVARYAQHASLSDHFLLFISLMFISIAFGLLKREEGITWNKLFRTTRSEMIGDATFLYAKQQQQPTCHHFLSFSFWEWNSYCY